jgi:hypothetical protein
MTLALRKYERLLKQDMWNAKSQEQEQIMALTTELSKIKDANLQLARSLSKKQSKSSDKLKPKKEERQQGKRQEQQGQIQVCPHRQMVLEEQCSCARGSSDKGIRGHYLHLVSNP